MHALPVADVFCFQQLKYGARSSESVYKKRLGKLGKLEDRTNSIATVFYLTPGAYCRWQHPHEGARDHRARVMPASLEAKRYLAFFFFFFCHVAQN